MVSRIGLCLVLVGLCAASAVGRETAAPDELLNALVAQEMKLVDAINAKDKVAIAELLGDETMSITSRGRQSTKQIVSALEELSFRDYEISDPKALSVSENVAILTYTFSWTGDRVGQLPKTNTVYASSVWKLSDGQWRSVFYQESPIAK